MYNITCLNALYGFQLDMKEPKEEVGKLVFSALVWG